MMAAASGGRTMMFLAGAIGFGIVAAILSVVYLKSREAAIRRSLTGAEQEMVAVVVANQDLKKGNKIEKGLFAVRNMPATYVHPNAIPPGNFDNYLGRFLVEDIGRGKPLLTNFMNESFPVDFSDLIAQGRRAMTIQVDEVQSISGLLRPGNRIDIYVNIATKIAGYDAGGKPATAAVDPALQEAALQVAAEKGVTIPEDIQAAARSALTENKPGDVILPVLQGIRVLSTGREAYDEYLDGLSYPQRRSELNFTSITVDVTPKQAALLAIADDKGDLIAVLRNRTDKDAAPFTGITPFDLYSNAKEMQEQDAIRKAAEAAGATLDANGNWVTQDGKVIRKEDIVVTDSGAVVAKDGQLLAANGVSVNSKGEYVDAQGNVLPPGDVIVNADGSITTKDQAMQAAGYTKNENGDYVDANGNVINAEDVKLLANGTLMTADGKVLSGDQVTVNKQGFIITEDGTVMTADGKVLSGVIVNEKGEVVGQDGKVLMDANLTVAADGTVRDSSGNVIAGITGTTVTPEFGGVEPGVQAPSSLLQNFISLIVGGTSKDGVAKTSRVPIQPLAEEPGKAAE